MATFASLAGIWFPIPQSPPGDARLQMSSLLPGILHQQQAFFLRNEWCTSRLFTNFNDILVGRNDLASLEPQVCLSSQYQAENPPADPINKQHSDNDDPGQFQDCSLIALPCHACHSRRRSTNTGAHVAEHFVGVVECFLGAGIVVDVEGDVFESRGLLG